MIVFFHSMRLRRFFVIVGGMTSLPSPCMVLPPFSSPPPDLLIAQPPRAGTNARARVGARARACVRARPHRKPRRRRRPRAIDRLPLDHSTARRSTAQDHEKIRTHEKIRKSKFEFKLGVARRPRRSTAPKTGFGPARRRRG